MCCHTRSVYTFLPILSWKQPVLEYPVLCSRRHSWEDLDILMEKHPPDEILAAFVCQPHGCFQTTESFALRSTKPSLGIWHGLEPAHLCLLTHWLNKLTSLKYLRLLCSQPMPSNAWVKAHGSIALGFTPLAFSLDSLAPLIDVYSCLASIEAGGASPASRCLSRTSTALKGCFP